MSSVPPSRHARCAQHALAAGPDGKCVVCRRASGVVVSVRAPDVATGGSKLLRAAVAVAAVGAALAASLGFAMRPSPLQPLPAAPEPVVRPQPIAAKVVSQDSAEAAAKAHDLAESLRKLERDEAERRELALALAEKDAAERAVADAERKREELERDRKRHEAVKKELDAMALGSARRNVAITMYSTSWCGACVKARGYMQAKNIAFTELDVEHDAAARAKARSLNPRGSVPTIAIDTEVMVGFSPESLESRITRAAKKRAGS